MYVPSHLEIKQPAVINQVISENGFGVLIGPDLNATHLPLILDPNVGQHGTLLGHFAKSNPHWQWANNQRVMVIFQGPHAYISPQWYATKPAVPTWNYVAVHCYGYLTLLSDEENIFAMDQLVTKYEPELLTNKEIMPEEYQARLRDSVVGFRIEIDEIHAKEKLGQHRKKEDQTGVYSGLKNASSQDANALASYMQNRNLGIGTS